MEGQPGSVPIQGTMGGQGSEGGGAPDFSSVIPEGFADKPYMKDIDSFDKLFNQFDNAQSLIGKKSIGVPTAESSDDEWNEYYSKIRPESADKYEFEEVQIPEGVDKSKFDDKWTKETFHKIGLTGKQAKELKKAYDERFFGMLQEQQDQIKAQDTEFESMLDKHFGDQKEAASARVNKLLQDNLPAEFKEQVKGLDNKSLMILTAALDGIHKKYIAEDSLGGGSPTPTQTPDEMRATARKLMMSPEYKDVMHPNHESTKKQVNEIYQKIGKIGQK